MTTRHVLLAVGLSVAVGISTAVAQRGGQPVAPERTPGVQAQSDPKREAFVAANCKTPPTPPAGPGGAARGSGAAAPAQPYALLEYRVDAIPGIIAAGQRWKLLW